MAVVAVLVNSCKEPVGVARGFGIAREVERPLERGSLKQVLLKRRVVTAENVPRHTEEQKRKTVCAYRFDRLGNKTVGGVHSTVKTAQCGEQTRVLLDVKALIAVKRQKVLNCHDPELLIVAKEKILLEHGTECADSRNLTDLGILQEIQDHLLNGRLECRIHYGYYRHCKRTVAVGDLNETRNYGS